DWPGNVRELEHVIERVVILGQGRVLRASDLKLPRHFPFHEEDSFRAAKARVVDHFERTYIESLLLTHQGNITLAAKAACKHRRAFWELMRKHQIEAGRFKDRTQSIPAWA
ncbi:MAG: sigma-54-dependent Fis family transcriptional regulator, partial [Acidobacteriota bacterium]